MSTDMLTTIRKIILRLVRVIIIALILIIVTTYGWKPIKPSISNILIDKQIPKKLKESVQILSEDIGIRNYAFYQNLEKTASFILFFYSLKPFFCDR